MKRKLLILVFLGTCSVLFIHTTPVLCGPISVSVAKNDSIHDIATILKEKKCIHSKKLFESYGILFGVKVQEGLYVIPSAKSLLEYIFLFEKNTYRKSIKITIPEGSSNKEIATICREKLVNCNKERFIEKAKELEGYLFPNTYEFLGTESEDQLIAISQKEFLRKTNDLFVNMSKKEIAHYITMASILEKEADNEKDMRVVAGILERRLTIGMPLQVDATLFFERGKTSAQLSINELQRDSLYNTYTNKGLPPTPISNPGLIALNAAINPEKSPYLFYLTGKDGKMYYAKTHEEHVKNKNLYLR